MSICGACYLQFLPGERRIAAHNLKRLLGKNGYLFLSEYPPETKTYYTSIFEAQGMPEGFARVFKHGITPGGISQKELAILFPPNQFEIVRQGKHVMNTCIPLTSGGFAQAPAFYLVVKCL